MNSHLAALVDFVKKNYLIIENCLKSFKREQCLCSVKVRESGKPTFGHLQQFIKEQWIDYIISEKCMSFDGLTDKERLSISGLVFEYEKALIDDNAKAIKILKALNFDKPSIDIIIG
ncbi:hypothetical protein [Sphingobacterium sp. DR205]|uniref:hypothetical protein n=1 Tax=Sphingobacterium sp. DR205 TaxID=2713573 RepID=UPI0013E417D8|nr:hypothetical protein [Sphingobacterium sp. DR205]QIH34215.1 hypothetical protein G6053_15545 [Sphingobacterium sp. DR205]